MMSTFKYLAAGIAMAVAGVAQAQSDRNQVVLASNTLYETSAATPASGNNTATAKPATLSPLLAKIERGRLIDAKEMIRSGADITDVSADGQTALHFAARKGYIELVNKLIDEGADVNARDNQGRTALDLTKETDYKFPREQRAITRLLEKAMN